MLEQLGIELVHALLAGLILAVCGLMKLWRESGILQKDMDNLNSNVSILNKKFEDMEDEKNAQISNLINEVHIMALEIKRMSTILETMKNGK